MTSGPILILHCSEEEHVETKLFEAIRFHNEVTLPCLHFNSQPFLIIHYCSNDKLGRSNSYNSLHILTAWPILIRVEDVLSTPPWRQKVEKCFNKSAINDIDSSWNRFYKIYKLVKL